MSPSHFETERKIKEKIVAYWSKSFYERERHEDESFLSFAEKLKANPAGFRVTAAQPKDLRRFLKKEYLNKKTGEVLDWTYGIPGARLVKALADWQVDELPKGYLRMLNVTGADMKTVLNAYGIEIKPHIYTQGDVRELKSNVKVF